MSLTADQLQANIDALEGALATGEKSVQLADRSVTYNSADEIVDRILYFKGQLRQLTAGRSRQSLGVTYSGL